MLVLNASIDRTRLGRAVEAGAARVLHDSAAVNEVARYVRRLRAGAALLSTSEVVEMLREEVGKERRQQHEARTAIERLTRREREVLEALAEGLEGKEIARRLRITAETERTHMANILNKLGAHSRLQALVFAARHGIVEIR